MKLRLAVNKPAINGYVNVDPMGGEDKVLSRVDNLEGIADAAECSEILAEDIMDFIPANKVMETLRYYCSKLRHGGKLIIGGSDLRSMCHAIITKRLNSVEANEMLFGLQTNTWDFKSGMINLDDLRGLIEDIGLKVTKSRLNNYKMVVEAVRE